MMIIRQHENAHAINAKITKQNAMGVPATTAAFEMTLKLSVVKQPFMTHQEFRQITEVWLCWATQRLGPQLGMESSEAHSLERLAIDVGID